MEISGAGKSPLPTPITSTAFWSTRETRILGHQPEKSKPTRYLLRMAKDLKLMSIDAYGFSAEKLDEIGWMVGGKTAISYVRMRR